jgi:hypothetical protein
MPIPESVLVNTTCSCLSFPNHQKETAPNSRAGSEMTKTAASGSCSFVCCCMTLVLTAAATIDLLTAVAGGLILPRTPLAPVAVLLAMDSLGRVS